MAVLGIACNLEGGRPIVLAVSLQGTRAAPSGREVFRHVADAGDDDAQQLRSLADHLETELRREPYEAVVVRAMDWSPQRRGSVARRRYQVEGALLAEARRHVELTESLSGKEIGVRCGTDKREAEEEAAAIVGEGLKEPAAAALAALVGLSDSSGD